MILSQRKKFYLFTSITLFVPIFILLAPYRPQDLIRQTQLVALYT